jgi:hypothetical protein
VLSALFKSLTSALLVLVMEDPTASTAGAPVAPSTAATLSDGSSVSVAPAEGTAAEEGDTRCTGGEGDGVPRRVSPALIGELCALVATHCADDEPVLGVVGAATTATAGVGFNVDGGEDAS